MIANYHTHTKRCRHAVGEDEEYVLAALDRGLKILGFSDHSPYVFPNGYYSDFRMYLNELEDYVCSILSLREKYSGRIQIPLGLELEYYPDCFPELMQVLRDYPIDYLLLGQHALGNEDGDCFTGWPTEDESVLKRYVDQTREAMNTGCFTYFAHPDVIRFEGSPEVYRRHMRTLIREAIICGLPLEFNLLGFQTNRHYPNRIFWELAAEEGAAAIIGVDAHAPAALRDDKLEEKARKLLGELDIKIMETVTFAK